MTKKKSTSYTLGRVPKVTSIHATVLPGSAMPADVKNRILTKMQARAFLRGYIDYLQGMDGEPETDIERNARQLIIQLNTDKLESLS